jgi:transposase
MTMLAERLEVVIGVDTHKHTHTAAAVTAATGAAGDTITVPADADGYARLRAWAAGHGGLRAFALEGAGGYGAGLARHLADAGEVVVEVDRPRRPARRAGAKTDEIDAVRAAREVLARTHLAAPRAGVDHDVLALHLAARRGAVQAAADARRQLHAVVVTAPETVRARLRAHTTPAALLAAAATLTTDPDEPADRREHAAVAVITALAARITYLQAETAAHDKALLAAVKAWRPDLLAQYGVGAITAATVLTAWSHPGRFRDEAAFAMLAGTAPVPASSGMTDRHRLNSSGDRRLNCALHTIAITRLRGDEQTRAYAAKCRARGKTTRETRRLLKRYIARALFRLLEHGPTSAPVAP